MSKRIAVVLIGDSDIDRWPTDLYPTTAALTSHYVSGASGASLQECVTLVPPLITQVLEDESSFDRILVIGCAGENDISRSYTLQESSESLQHFISAVFRVQQHRIHLVFLGPKLEPWLDYGETTVRRDYVRMSRAFEKICVSHALASQIRYVDCLLMFCGDSASRKGALLGGQAKADKVYFDYDLLHLNGRGYQIWKQKVEEYIGRWGLDQTDDQT